MTRETHTVLKKVYGSTGFSFAFFGAQRIDFRQLWRATFRFVAKSVVKNGPIAPAKSGLTIDQAM